MPFRVRLSHFEENRLPLSLKADCDVKGGIIDLFCDKRSTLITRQESQDRVFIIRDFICEIDSRV